ncbi:unnamed protein product (macronuclear) [Paramecium tetraurelia]|uniref:C2HC/C3H-type domain-containing protein n=1 Tax=Paramecium tetraurelia TaxID=5888 RepID=A0BJ34_PARTE|nr:uncharacterized protein GSPATT00004924001 [Paramecium tetraurelia]CAK58551.1 unnamed protein product [Paramecium tetraurelia]|eukprot:XP_001425949.1 hypothetical protein (macronuclear) [Paramecium tetraurelia strain d4-2]
MRKTNTNQKTNDNNLNYLNGGGFAVRPKSLLCTICGREFGTASLEIHQKTCIKKYQNDLINMDPGHRQQMPTTQQVLQKLNQEKQVRQQGGTKVGQKSQQVLYEQPQQVMALVGCRKCGRRFNPDRIRKHESVCIGPEPDIQKIKEQQQEQNKRAAKYLKPKKTGKWKQEHLEFQQAMREMRKVRQQEIAEGRGNPFGHQQYGQSYGVSNKQQPTKYGKGNQYQQNYNNQPQSRQYQQQKQPQYQQQQQQYSQKGYSQSVKATHKQPTYEQQQTKMVQKSPISQMPQKQYQQPTKSSYNDVGYGRPAYNAGGGASYQIAHSNVSTFSLFTQDGKPKNYDNYQQNNPYVKKNGLY